MDRRKDSLFWKTLNLVVNLTFLLLAVTIMTILLKNDSYRADVSSYEVALSELRQDVNKVNQSNFVYLEGKINAVATNQDSYQNNTTRRVDVLEQRMKTLEEKRLERRNNIVNNNNNILSTPKN
jgi:cell shape-determining protein MreC